jgi:hypothetical protein
MSKISNDNINYQAISALKFPKNYNDAYQHVLRNEDMPDIVGTYSDKLESEGMSHILDDLTKGLETSMDTRSSKNSKHIYPRS